MCRKRGTSKNACFSHVWKLSYTVLSSLYLWSVLKNLLSVFFYINSRFDPRLIFGWCKKNLIFKCCHDQEVSVQKALSSQSTSTWFLNVFIVIISVGCMPFAFILFSILEQTHRSRMDSGWTDVYSYALQRKTHSAIKFALGQNSNTNHRELLQTTTSTRNSRQSLISV